MVAMSAAEKEDALGTVVLYPGSLIDEKWRDDERAGPRRTTGCQLLQMSAQVG